MILNAFAILDFFLSLLRLLLAVGIAGLALATWSRGRTLKAMVPRQRLEDRGYLVILAAIVLFGLNLVAWPMLYVVLQSYVPQWPGVMCIYGVTQVGLGSEGPSRFLPILLQWVQLAKVLAVFASGAWFVLFLLNRATRDSALMPRVLVALGICGIISAGDSAGEIAYLAIPKKEVRVEAGCCAKLVGDLSQRTKFLPTAYLPRGSGTWLTVSHYALQTLIIAWLLRNLTRPRSADDPRLGIRCCPLIMLVALAMVVGGLFLSEVLAPSVLRLPFHHCPYDLIFKAPESIVGIVQFLLGGCALGWACVATRWGCVPEIADVRRRFVDRLQFLGLLGLLASLVMVSMELVLA